MWIKTFAENGVTQYEHTITGERIFPGGLTAEAAEKAEAERQDASDASRRRCR